MSRYATFDEARPYGYQLQPDDKDLIEAIIPRASAVFDKLVGVSSDYFGTLPATPAVTVEATEKTFYGTGLHFLALPVHYDFVSALLPDNYTQPTFVSADDGWLYLTDSFGNLYVDSFYAAWPKGVPVKVIAKWGYAAIPDDVKEAVLELTIAIWRSKDSAFLRAVQIENQQIVNEAVPKRTLMVARKYRSQILSSAAFV